MENSPRISQEFIKVGPGIKIQTDKILHPEIDPIVEGEVKVETEEIIEIIIDPITEIDQEADGTTIGQVLGVTTIRLTIDKVILDQITDKMPNGHLETEVKVEIELGITIMNIREVEVEIDMITGLLSQDKAHYLMEEMNLGLDLTLAGVSSVPIFPIFSYFSA